MGEDAEEEEEEEDEEEEKVEDAAAEEEEVPHCVNPHWFPTLDLYTPCDPI